MYSIYSSISDTGGYIYPTPFRSKRKNDSPQVLRFTALPSICSYPRSYTVCTVKA